MPAFLRAFCVPMQYNSYHSLLWRGLRAMTIREKMTIADFDTFISLPENADKRYELLDGVLHEMSPSSELPTVIAMRLGILLGSHVYANRLGFITGADGRFDLSSTDHYAPDVAFIAAARLEGIRRRGFFQIAPDLAVEIVSPSDSIPAVQRKAARYLALGVREVWIIYPDEQTADVYRPAESPNRLEVQQIAADGALESNDLLPNFRLPLQQLFELGKPILDDES
jgi:Uma2 family endonuclease